VTVPSSDAGGLPLDLDRIEARAEAATPGPWFAKENDLIGGWCVMPVDDVPSNGVYEVADFAHREAAEFIAAARTEVPALVAWVRALEAEVQQLQEQNGRLEAWRATPRAFDWKGTF
jgi:hypothetical protein